MGVSELHKLKQLEDENARLRRIVADLTLDKRDPAGGRTKIVLKAVKRRELAAWMQERFKISVRRSCDLALATVRVVRQEPGPRSKRAAPAHRKRGLSTLLPDVELRSTIA